jgi:hypothetical protein
LDAIIVADKIGKRKGHSAQNDRKREAFPMTFAENFCGGTDCIAETRIEPQGEKSYKKRQHQGDNSPTRGKRKE